MSCVFIEAGVSLWPSYGLATGREDNEFLCNKVADDDNFIKTAGILCWRNV